MPTLIIHTSSRVIRKMTTDAPQLEADESAVNVADGFDLAGGPWKLAADNVTKVAPTDPELDAAFIRPFSTNVGTLITALDDLLNNGDTVARRRAIFAAIRAHFGTRTRSR
jgi:hypothetical protein